MTVITNLTMLVIQEAVWNALEAVLQCNSIDRADQMTDSVKKVIEHELKILARQGMINQYVVMYTPATIIVDFDCMILPHPDLQLGQSIFRYPGGGGTGSQSINDYDRAMRGI